MNYELLIFDWDGTLMDSAGDIVTAMQQATADMGMPQRTPRELRRVIGLGLMEAFHRLYPELSDEEMTAIIERYSQRFRGLPKVFGRPFNGAEEVLKQLQAQGYKLAVATGKSRKGLDRALEAASWADYFVASRCADETASKPDPMMLDELLWELDVSADKALMIGDTTFDMDMARQARMHGLALACGVHEDDELLACGVQALLPDVSLLPQWLEQQQKLVG